MPIAFLGPVGRAFDDAIVDAGKLPEFLLFLSFLVAWAFIRTSAHMIRAQVSWWPGNVSVGGTHVHHMVWGISAMMIVGYITLAFDPDPPVREVLAILFGVGMGLTLDEFALWLNLKDVYWEQQGRESIDAVAVAIAVGALLLLGIRVWIDLADDVERAVRGVVAFAGALGVAIGIVNVAKGKLGWAVVSLVLPPLGLVGAVRIARPGSIWHHLYGEKGTAKARKRYPHESLAVRAKHVVEHHHAEHRAEPDASGKS